LPDLFRQSGAKKSCIRLSALDHRDKSDDDAWQADGLVLNLLAPFFAERDRSGLAPAIHRHPAPASAAPDQPDKPGDDKGGNATVSGFIPI